MEITKRIIDMDIEDIKRIPLIELSTVPYDEETQQYDLPNKIQFYYWEKGCKPDIYLKAELNLHSCYIDAVSKTIHSEKEYKQALIDMREELVDMTIREKFELVCEEYMGLLKPILVQKGEDIYEYDRLQAIEVLVDSDKVEKRWKKELPFYKEMFENDLTDLGC